MNEVTNAVGASAVNSRMSSGSGQGGSWFEAMADAWGKVLDNQMGEVEDIMDEINKGDDSLGTVNMLTAQAQRLTYLANSAHTTVTTVGSALDTMARKQ